MSHYHCEIVIPPTDDIESAVRKIMGPFNEEEGSRCGFWDWLVVGGRFAGEKIKARCGETKLKEFYAALKANGITVSGLQCGKHELSPASQIPTVDKMWKEFFPDSPDGPCPLFAHSNNQYESGDLLTGDICELKDVPENLVCNRVIFSTPDGREAMHMLADSIWNGVTWQDTTWADGKFSKACELFEQRLNGCSDGYRQEYDNRASWLVVTVDYHS